MDEIRPGLSDAERESLRALWDHGPGTVRQILELLGRGGAAGRIPRSRPSSGGSRPRATPRASPSAGRWSTAPRSPARSCSERRLKDAAEELCDGAAAPLVLALVQGNRFTPEELDRIRGLIEDARKKPGGPSR